MAKVFTAQNNFTSGKLSALVQARTNLKAYNNGLKTCENFIVLPHGGITRRGGFTYVAAAKNATGNTRLIPFIFNTNPKQSYILEFDGSDLVIRVYYGYDKTVITKEGATYEIDLSTWLDDEDDIPNIRYMQSADVLYMVDGAHPVHTLTRSGDADDPTFVLAPANLVGKPYSTYAPVTVSIYKTPKSTYAAWRNQHGYFGDALSYSFLFNEEDSSVSIINKIDNQGSDYAMLFGQPLSSSEKYNNEDSTIYDYIYNNVELHAMITADPSGDRAYVPSFKIESELWCPTTDTYYFAINTRLMGDVFVDEKEVVSLRGDYYSLKEKDAIDEFSVYGSIDLAVGAHPIQARFTAHNTGITSGYGIAVAWRNGQGPYYNGTMENGTGNAEMVFASDPDNEDYFGNKVFEIIIKASPSGQKFGWTWREMTSHPDAMTDDWPDEDTVLGSDDWNTASPNGWMVTPTDAGGEDWRVDGNYYDLKSHPSSPTWMFGGFYVGDLLQTTGDYWTIRVGFTPIESSDCRKQSDSSDTYPRTLTFHENRLILAGFENLPTVRGSRTGLFNDFQKGSNDDDALEFTISSNKIDPIQWIKSGRRLLVGTTSCEYSISGDRGVITPSDIMVVPHTFYGGAFIDPVVVGNSIIFSENSGLRLREYYYRYDIDGYYGEDQSILSYEELENKAKEIVYQKSGLAGYKGDYSIYIPPSNLIWIITDSYELKAITFEKSHEVIAWHTHDLGGSTVEVQSIAVIPGSDGSDELWALVKRDDARYIEYLSSSAAYDNDGGADQITFTATAETLPIQYDEEGNVTRMFKKRWAEIRAYLYGARNVSVAEGSDTWASWKQTFGTVAVGPEDERLGGTGWDEESTLVLKSEPDSSPSLTSTSVTGLDDLSFGASNSYTGSDEPTIVVTIDGEGATDTFKWSLNGTEQDTTVAITGSEQQLGTTGIYIEFAAITGHTEDDYWTIEWAAYPATILQLHGKVIINEP